MMHTIVDLDEVLAEPERQNTEEKFEEHMKNVISYDAMRLLHFNGN